MSEKELLENEAWALSRLVSTYNEIILRYVKIRTSYQIRLNQIDEQIKSLTQNKTEVSK